MPGRLEFGIKLEAIAAHLLGIDQAIGIHAAAHCSQLRIFQS
jgi:hypothetical protein